MPTMRGSAPAISPSSLPPEHRGRHGRRRRPYRLRVVGTTNPSEPEILVRMPRLRGAKSSRVMASTVSRDQILALMREQLDVIRATGTRVGSDPEELRQMRAAVRRLRAILGAVRDMFDPKWVAGLRSELDWLGTVLGDRRDLDVLREYLRTELASLKPAARVAADLLDLVDAQRARASSAILAVLDGGRYEKLLSRLELAVQRPKVVAADLSLSAVAAEQFKKLRKAVKALPGEPSDSDLHAVRIRLK